MNNTILGDTIFYVCSPLTPLHINFLFTIHPQNSSQMFAYLIFIGEVCLVIQIELILGATVLRELEQFWGYPASFAMYPKLIYNCKYCFCYFQTSLFSCYLFEQEAQILK
eukprot:TRINITY_DN9622_c2_g1_i1.p3 TRINITY_DN9622_c2_g1~~TRINITY_DN9622_c2_g1_i1.p3  ORF type:complete len:110 (-),score=5.49 TRINITY_DN9622_c2_g1_i1:241-570(-)